MKEIEHTVIQKHVADYEKAVNENVKIVCGSIEAIVIEHFKKIMPNKLLTNEEFDEDLTKAYANTECQHIIVSDVSFERMKKYMNQDKIDKAEYLREIIRSNPDYFLIKYA